MTSPPPLNNPAARRLRRITALTILIPLVGFVAAVVLGIAVGVSGRAWVLFAVGYALSIIGVEVGFHRLFSHRSFEARPSLRYALAVLGSGSWQGSPLFWVATHRLHHQKSDGADDPHSPHGSGASLARRFWRAHIGWLFAARVEDIMKSYRYIPDLLRDRSVMRISQRYPLIMIAAVLVPGMVGGIWGWSWYAALEGALWGGLVRVFACQHSIWAVNSVCHLWGSRPFSLADHSRNNALLALPTFGGGWHNNHHAFPSSAYAGIRWWEIDLCGLFIRVCAFFGLASGVKQPSAGQLARARGGQAES